jgi:hypothetical protein
VAVGDSSDLTVRGATVDRISLESNNKK